MECHPVLLSMYAKQISQHFSGINCLPIGQAKAKAGTGWIYIYTRKTTTTTKTLSWILPEEIAINNKNPSMSLSRFKKVKNAERIVGAPQDNAISTLSPGSY